MREETASFIVGIAIFLFIALFIGVLVWGFPKYRIYSRENRGLADLKEAEWSRQIAIEEARAKKESAILEAEAEVERAKGVAQSNEIIADGLKDNEEYLRYLWINNLESGEKEVVYIPTEAGLPLLEARDR